MILSSHYDDGSELVLITPLRQRQTFAFRSVDIGDLHYIRHAKRPQFFHLPGRNAEVRHPPTDELTFFFVGRFRKDRNSIRDACLHEIRCFKQPRGARIEETAPAALQLTAYRNETPPRLRSRAKSGSQRLPIPRSGATCGLPGGYRRGIASMIPSPAAAMSGKNN
jgi:hypothetical protein